MSVDNTDLRSIKRLMQQQDFVAALRDLNAIQTDEPHIEVLFLQAVCQRYLGELDTALSTLGTLLNTQPDFAKAYQEQGHCLRLQGKIGEALLAFQRAVNLHPALLASWKQLHALARQTHENALAEQAQKQIQTLQALPPVVLQATGLFYEKKLALAEQITRKFLRTAPKNVPAMRLLANIAKQLYILEDAEILLANALKFSQHELAVELEYIEILQKRQKHRQAYEQAQSCAQRHPDDPMATLAFANQCMGIGDIKQAIVLFSQVIDELPTHANVYIQRGHAYKTQGQTDKAVADYRHAYQLKVDFGDAYWSLANLKTYQFSELEMQQMLDLVNDNHVLTSEKYHMCFALGKAYEDQGEFQRSFMYYTLGNELKANELGYSADVVSEQMAAQKQFCPPSMFTHNLSTCTDPAPIFIVGLPRAGSTLLEQILASHSLIEGTTELPNILAFARRLSGNKKGTPAYPENLASLSVDQLTALGEEYLRETQIHRSGKPFFIDKMPNNFRHLGLIKKILPNAKIIDARREPMACCFSGYKQLFAEGQEFSYRQSDIAQYYCDYVELMAHWETCFPENILRVQHEDVLDDLAGQVERMLAFIGVDFEASCLSFYNTQRNVKTPSAEQVRQPINQKARYQWQQYAPYLSDLSKVFNT
ncbi:MAG: sulfotransferase [Glaciecola sp.]|jgi:tetratricopeptide (TPR) repeat protein